jgi:hypothetical protein
MCNGQKGEQFPVNAKGRGILIDPSSNSIDPEKHIGFIVDDGPYDPIGMPIHRTRRGRTTIETIGLYLPHYVRLRLFHFKKIVQPAYMKLLAAKKDGDIAEWSAAKLEFEDLLIGQSPFVSFVRCFARRRRLDTIGIDIPSGSCW